MWTVQKSGLEQMYEFECLYFRNYQSIESKFGMEILNFVKIFC